MAEEPDALTLQLKPLTQVEVANRLRHFKIRGSSTPAISMQRLHTHYLNNPRTVLKYAAPEMPKQTYDRILEILRDLPWHHLQANTGSVMRREIAGLRHTFTLGATLGPLGGDGFQETCTKGNRTYGMNSKVVKGKVKNPLVAADLQELWDTMKQLMKQIDPDFSFTSLHATENFVNTPHKDKNNISHSYAVSFGDFTGGELTIETSDPSVIVSYDTKGRPTPTDGRRIHWVEPYEGTRYSIILYAVYGEPTPVLSNFPPNHSPGSS